MESFISHGLVVWSQVAQFLLLVFLAYESVTVEIFSQLRLLGDLVYLLLIDMVIFSKVKLCRLETGERDY